MICTPFRRDSFVGKIKMNMKFYFNVFILESGSVIVTQVLIFIDFIYLIPYVKIFEINKFFLLLFYLLGI
jgi:hypothetical protein